MSYYNQPTIINSSELVGAIVSTRDGLQAFSGISHANSQEIRSIVGQLQEANSDFNGWVSDTMDMLREGAWTSQKTKQFFEVVEVLDKRELQSMLQELRPAIEKSQAGVQDVVYGLRGINTTINEAATEVRGLIAGVEQKKRNTAAEHARTRDAAEDSRKKFKKADSDRDDAIGGLGVGLALAGIFAPFLLPAALLIGGAAVAGTNSDRKVAKRSMQSLEQQQTELAKTQIQLENTLSKAMVIQHAMPELLESFDQIYDFWSSLDTDLKGVQIEKSGKSRLMYKRNALLWGRIQETLQRSYLLLAEVA